MPPQNRIAYDVACTLLAATEIISKAATIRAEQLLGQHAARRDWYGHEIGVKEGAQQRDSDSGPAYNKQVAGDHLPSPSTETTVPQPMPIPPIFDKWVDRAPPWVTQSVPSANSSRSRSDPAVTSNGSMAVEGGGEVRPAPKQLWRPSPATPLPPLAKLEEGETVSPNGLSRRLSLPISCRFSRLLS